MKEENGRDRTKMHSFTAQGPCCLERGPLAGLWSSVCPGGNAECLEASQTCSILCSSWLFRILGVT